ncbi:uncharacterized protein [Miscanthus floridulus]|uniref:uncharacterized protein n=1 Tax=Miscanthus floridulus TaxID=154761 RepID=UPI00345AFA4B
MRPPVREKRRWSFRRPGAGAGAGASGGAQGQGPLASSSSHCFSEAEVHVVVVAQEQDQQQQVATTAVVVPEAASSTAGAVVTLPASGRRSADRDAEAAAAVRIQAAFRSCAERLRLLEVKDITSSRQQDVAAATPRPQPSRRSPQHPRSRKPPEAVERGSEENDVGGAVLTKQLAVLAVTARWL